MNLLLQNLAAFSPNVLDQVGEAIMVFAPATDPDKSRIVWVNEAFCALTGYTLEEVRGAPPWLLEGPATDQHEVARLRATLAAGQPFWGCLANHRKSGEPVDIEWSVTPLRDMTGAVTHCVCLQRDVSQRNRAQARLAAAEQRFRAIAECGRDGLYICRPMRDVDGRIIDFGFVYVNAAAAAISGSSAAALIEDSTLLTLVPDFASNDFFKKLVGLMEDGGAASDEIRLLRPGVHERWLCYSATRLRDELALNVRDETESRTIERMLRQSQKLESVGRLAAGIAHDFNNFLSSIIGFGTFVRESLPTDDPLQNDLQEILSNAQRASKLTRQLLAIGRQQALAPQVMDLFAAVLNLSGMLRRLLGEGIELHTRRRSGHGMIKADPGQVEQVLLNLAINARDAMGAHGTLTIECDSLDLSVEEARHHPGTAAGPFVKLSVRDTGHGMTREVMDRIFEPFFTTKPPGKGTGLGLPVVYGIVKQSGGFLKVSSEAGAGSTFEIYFPRSVERPTAIPPAPEVAAPEDTRGNELVLVVEDDASVRAFVRRLLTRNGYGVLEAEDGRDALEVSKHSEHIALLLTDVMMARMDGFTLANEMRLSFPDMKVVFMSGYSRDFDFDVSLEDARTVFLQKPLEPQRLLVTLRQVLDGAAAATK